mmetsp:Transcript_34478/g.103105  ORF Transcript_34478/g.103105 Transcript_34478/m.103105 type:complete len:233 (+) Transcript_34478:643-1341(+)
MVKKAVSSSWRLLMVPWQGYHSAPGRPCGNGPRQAHLGQRGSRSQVAAKALPDMSTCGLGSGKTNVARQQTCCFLHWYPQRQQQGRRRREAKIGALLLCHPQMEGCTLLQERNQLQQKSEGIAGMGLPILLARLLPSQPLETWSLVPPLWIDADAFMWGRDRPPPLPWIGTRGRFCGSWVGALERTWAAKVMVRVRLWPTVAWSGSAGLTTLCQFSTPAAEKPTCAFQHLRF